MRVYNTDKAPKAIGPYSQAVSAGGFLFLSGQIGIDPETGELAEGLESQAKQIFANISAVLHAAGLDKEKIVKTTIFLKNIKDFKKVNALYADFFGDHKPARSTVEVSDLPKGALLEIEAIAEL